MAEIGLERCKDEQTMIYCVLVEDAMLKGDWDRVKKLQASARRKRRVNAIKVDEVVKNVQGRLQVSQD